MTELIVALDGPNMFGLATRLHDEVGVTWFKIGEQRILDRFQWETRAWLHKRGAKLFLDLKYPGVGFSVAVAIRRAIGEGVTAVSTFTYEATIAACDIAKGTDLKIWQVIQLTDETKSSRPGRYLNAHGVICPGHMAETSFTAGIIDVVVPGVGFKQRDGHTSTTHPYLVKKSGATYAVVGRPIWQADDPVMAARTFQKALGGQ